MRLIRNQVGSQGSRGFESLAVRQENAPFRSCEKALGGLTVRLHEDLLMLMGCGEVTEWLKVLAWKACVGQPTEGSNPSLSAIKGLIFI